MRLVEITGVRAETPTVKTLTFNDGLCSKAVPGQFVMVWIPSIDEVPMSLSIIGPKSLSGITVRKVGEATTALHRKIEGEIIGLRGPFGNGFELVRGRALVVAGGTGLAPLLPLTERLEQEGDEIIIILGAKTLAELYYPDRLRKKRVMSMSILESHEHVIIVTTEDGSYGIKGLPTDPIEPLMKERGFDILYTCGPETMMFKAFQVAEKYSVPVQASLERYIKCGIGLCGQCVLDPLGLTVCRDGPVFTSETLREIADFGRFSRDACGRKVSIG
ncbi:MAG: dihydroorotate dehydrogenase electron transfer subunit [Candidatus Bathyarchaeia archaeon]